MLERFKTLIFPTAAAILLFLLLALVVDQHSETIAWRITRFLIALGMVSWLFLWRTIKRFRLARKPFETQEGTVLYLRSFSDDSNAPTGLADWLFNPLTLMTIEENAVSQLRRIGQVVAVGCPADLLPPLGAVRIYVDGKTEWKDVVSNGMRAANLIVIHLGASEGLGWEIATAVKLWSDKLLLIFPTFDWNQNKSREKLYESIRKQILTESGVLLPAYFPGSFCIGFSKELGLVPIYPSNIDTIRSTFCFGGEFSILMGKFVTQYLENNGIVEAALKHLGQNQEKPLSPFDSVTRFPFVVEALISRIVIVVSITIFATLISAMLAPSKFALSILPFAAAASGGLFGLLSPRQSVYRHMQHQVCIGVLVGFLAGLIVASCFSVIVLSPRW